MSRRRLIRVLVPLLFLAVPGALMLVRMYFPHVDALRLAIYIFPLGVIYLLLMRAAARPVGLLQPIHEAYFRPQLVLYLGLLAVSLLALVLREVHLRFFEEAWFILAPLLSAALFFTVLPPGRPARRYDRVLAVVFVGLYLLTTAPRLTAFLDVFRWEVFVTSTIDTESGLAFPLGMMAVYFLARRDFPFAAITGFLVFLSYKRIALAATALALLAFFVASALRLSSAHTRRALAITAVVANLAVVFVSLQFAMGRYDSLAHHWFGVSANEFSMGRRHMQSLALSGLGIVPDALDLAVTMKGLGSVHEYLASIRGALSHMHSDLMKGLVEFGLFGFIAWIYVFYRVHSFSPTAFALGAYWNVVWLTDNTFIYFDVAFVFYTLVGLAFLAQAPVSRNAQPKGSTGIQRPTADVR